jgi:nitroreductase
MRKAILFFIFALSVSFLSAQENSALKIIINHFGARNYSATAVSKAELDQIVLAGVRAPSASNRQPWHITVVQNQTLARQILSQATEGNAVIVVSAAGDGKTNGSVILDCGLAVQSMYLAAQALGLGSRIYTNPIDTINSRFKADLGLPRDHNAIAVIRVGRLAPGVDVVSSASSRNDTGRMVTYK